MAVWGLLCEVMRVELTIRAQGIDDRLQLDFYRGHAFLNALVMELRNTIIFNACVCWLLESRVRC
jgi:hypothetical protein